MTAPDPRRAAAVRKAAAAVDRVLAAAVDQLLNDAASTGQWTDSQIAAAFDAVDAGDRATVAQLAAALDQLGYRLTLGAEKIA
jgi:hypothetical protein